MWVEFLENGCYQVCADDEMWMDRVQQQVGTGQYVVVDVVELGEDVEQKLICSPPGSYSWSWSTLPSSFTLFSSSHTLDLSP